MILQVTQFGANTVVILYVFNQLIPHPHIEGGGFIITVLKNVKELCYLTQFAVPSLAEITQYISKIDHTMPNIITIIV